MGNSRVRTRRRVLAYVGAAAAALSPLAVPVAAEAATPPGVYSVTVSPATVKAAQTMTQTVAFKNAAPPASLDLMNRVTVTLNGFTNVSAPATATSPTGARWTVTVVGQTVTLQSRAGSIPGDGVAIPITAKAPTVAGPYVWPTSASGRIGGAIGSTPFTRQGPALTKVVQPGNPAQLTFLQPPTIVQVGNVMTPPVRVAVKDTFGNTVTNYVGSVTLRAEFNPNTGTNQNPPGLPRTKPVVNGVATFDDIVITAIGIGYRVRATSGSLAPAISGNFDVTQVLQGCLANTECFAGPVGPPDNTTASIVDRVGSNDDVFSLTVGGLPALDCSDSRHGLPATFDNRDLTRVMEITLTLKRPLVQTVPGFSYMICFASKQNFTTFDGGTSVPGANGMFYGILPFCADVAEAPPCLISRTRPPSGDVVAVIRSTPGDPRGMFGIIRS